MSQDQWHKSSVIVGAPEVYKPTTDGNVDRGKADESATQALDEISKKFAKKTLDYSVGNLV